MSKKIGIQLYGLSEIRKKFQNPAKLTSQSRVEWSLYQGLINYLPADWEIETLLTKPWTSFPSDEDVEKGRNILRTHLWAPPLLPFGNSITTVPLRRFLENRIYPEKVKSLRLDICHLTWGCVQYPESLASVEIYNALDFSPQRNRPEWWAGVRERCQERHEKLFVSCISHATAKDAVRFLGVPEERVRTIHLAVDHDVFRVDKKDDEDAFVEKHRLNLPYFLYVGALYGRKNLTTLLTALERFNEGRSEAIPLVVIGAKGAPSIGEQARLENQIAALRYTEYRHLGMLDVEEMAMCYRHAMAHTHAATFEGFGLTVLESLASGCPVICGHNSSLIEVGGDAVTFVSDVEDADEWVSVLERFVETSVGDVALIEKGITHAKTFTWERYGRESAEFTEMALKSL